MSGTPPPYSNYPRYQQPYGGPGGPRVGLECLTEAWNIVSSDIWTWIAASLITIVLGYAIDAPFIIAGMYLENGGQILPSPGATPSPIGMLEAQFLSIIGACGIYTLSTGLGYMGLQRARGFQTSLGDLFVPFKRFFSVASAWLLLVLAVVIGFICFIVPGIYLVGLLFFAPLLVVDKGLGPIAALRKSAEMLKPYAWMMFLVIFVLQLISGLGVLACCVGVLLTMPIQYVGIAVIYRTFDPVDTSQINPIGYAPPSY